MKWYVFKKFEKYLFMIIVFVVLPFMVFSYEKVVKLGFSSRNYRAIEIENINGPVIVEAKKTDFINITAIITGKRENVEKTKIVDNVFSKKLKVKAKFPQKSDNLSVSFSVEIPMEFDLIVSTVNGKINVDGLSGKVILNTVNGIIEGEVKELRKGKFSTVNGSIELFVEKFSGNSSIKTVNGSVRIKSKHVDNLKLIAKSINGSINIKNDGFVKIENKGASIFSIPIPPRKKVVYGKAPKYEVVVSTVNGSIYFE